METEPAAESVDVEARIEEIFRAFENKGAVGAESKASYRFVLEGDHGGAHLLEVSPGAAAWKKDYDGEADVEIKLSVVDFLALADGNFDGRLAVASERIELSGNLELAEALIGMIEPDEAIA